MRARVPRKARLTWLALALLTVGSVGDLGSAPTSAVLGLASIGQYLLPAIVFLVPAALVSAELASGWEGGVYNWVSEGISPAMGFAAVWCQFAQTTFYYPAVLAYVASTLSHVFAPGLAHSGVYQTVEESGSGTDLGFLGASQNGTASGIVTIHYTDGSSQSFNLNIADWYADAPAVGDQIVTTTSSWNFQSNPLGPHPVNVYFASVPLAHGKTVSSVTLPVLTGAGGTTAMHIFAMATGNGTPSMGAPYPSLTAAYDNSGISDNSDPSAADFDGTGESFSAQALAAGTPTPLTPGGQATIGGATFTWPTAVGAPDNVIADGQIIDLSGSGSELGFLGAGAFGEATGTGTITYTDGSTQPYSIAMADWYNNAPVSGDQVANTTSSWNFSSSSQVQHPVSIYFASVPLDPSKTVASVTLPTVSSGIGNGVNAMHIFAIAVGSGTPTSTSAAARSNLAAHGQRGEGHFQ